MMMTGNRNRIRRDRGVSMVDTRKNRITVCACMILRNYKRK